MNSIFSNVIDESSEKKGLLSLLYTVILPTLILIKGHSWAGLKPITTLLLALVFPIGFGLYHYWSTKHISILSLLGLVSVLFTGGVGLLHFPKNWMPIKEASISFIIGTYVLLTSGTSKNLMQSLICNPKFLNVEAIQTVLTAKNLQVTWQKLLRHCSYAIGSSFFISSILHYIITKHVLISEPGTTEFTQELGRIHFWSFLIISIPCVLILLATFYYFFMKLKKLTGLNLEILMPPGN
jgi:intracellular septation protein A